MLRNVVLGWEATCRINDVDFGVKEGTIEWNIDDEECGDSFNAEVKAHKPGRFDCAITLGFYEKSDVATLAGKVPNPGSVILLSVAPSASGDPEGLILIGEATGNFRSAAEVKLQIDEQGNTLPGRKIWDFPSVVLSNYRDGWNMDGKMEGTLSGHSNGVFTPPQN